MKRYVVVSDDCVNATSVNSNGYGNHRRVYEREVGPIPAGMELDHLCLNRRCVNVLHLEAVSASVNRQRIVQRGNHNKALLTDEQVAEIRSRYVRSGHRTSNRHQLADEFGVDHHVIKKIVIGVTYRWVAA